MISPQRPPPISNRPVVQVVCPSGSLADHQEALSAGLAALERAGAEVRWDPHHACARWRDYFAGTDAERTQPILNALDDPEVDIIWCARGGSGAARITEKIVAHAARCRPRAVIGFSDATTLLNALTSQLGWVTGHGPVVTTLGRHPERADHAIDSIFARLQGDVRPIQIATPQPIQADPTPISGRLMGGNLTVLASLCGTPLAPDLTDAVVVLEEVAESPYQIQRTFWQLKASGMLSHARAIWLGDLGLDAERHQAVWRHLQTDAGALPIVPGAPAGHRGELTLLPLGLEISLNVHEQCLQLRQPMVAR